jgi:hypothetical protein
VLLFVHVDCISVVFFNGTVIVLFKISQHSWSCKFVEKKDVDVCCPSWVVLSVQLCDGAELYYCFKIHWFFVVFDYTCVESRRARDTNPLTVDPSCGNVRSDSWNLLTVLVMCFVHFTCCLTLAQLSFANGREVILLFLIPSLSLMFTLIVSLCLYSVTAKCMN